MFDAGGRLMKTGVRAFFALRLCLVAERLRQAGEAQSWLLLGVLLERQSNCDNSNVEVFASVNDLCHKLLLILRTNIPSREGDSYHEITIGGTARDIDLGDNFGATTSVCTGTDMI